jgi:hypothetical protein
MMLTLASGSTLTGVGPPRDMVPHSGRSSRRHYIRCSAGLGSGPRRELVG